MVAAYVTVEKDVRSLKKIVTKLKIECGKTFEEEIKLKDLTEDQYVSLLSSLLKLDGTLFSTATDMSILTDANVMHHRDVQAGKIIKHKDKMIYEEARNGLEQLSIQVRQLSPQLYMQLVCQVDLISDVINRAILYYVQRHPKCLKRFKWRIDQKNTKKIQYEEAFEKVTPALLQTISIENPTISVREFDYSAMAEFVYSTEDAPNYLKETYGLNVDATDSLNIGKILHQDLRFDDSKQNIGIQVVDLLAAGLRRILRGQFRKMEEISRLLGGLMVQALQGQMPINLISFTDGQVCNYHAKKAIRNFYDYSRPMLL